MSAYSGYSSLVDLRPDEKGGDRIAVVRDGEVAYLPARRVNLGVAESGSSGNCRYVKRSANGDLYVTGPALDDQIVHSSDGGHTWTSSTMQLNAGKWIWMAAFSILRDDTFMMLLMPSNWTVNSEAAIARSKDLGKTWSIQAMAADLSPYKCVQGGNADILELADGTLLATVDLCHGEDFDGLPVEQRGLFEHVFRSFDGGRTWPEKSCITIYAAETHLLELPSGKLLACIRKQRWHRLPGDPASVVELAKRYGWTPAASGGLMEGSEGTNRIKNMFVSESCDGGYTWVNEQQVTPQMKCSGDFTYLEDGTLVLQYLHRYDGPIAREGIRARVSYDQGGTWEPEEYVLSDGAGRYPSGIDMPDGSMITICPYAGQLQAVHWRPPPRGGPAPAYSAVPAAKSAAAAAAPCSLEETEISVITDGTTTALSAARVNLLPPPPGVRHAPIWYGCNSAILQRGDNGELFCMGNVAGPCVLSSADNGRSWDRADLDIEGWGSLVGFRIPADDSFLVMYEPVGGGHRCLRTARSTDRGKTWNVTAAKLDMGAFTQVAGKDNNMLELPDGALLAALQLWGGQDDAGKEAPAAQAEGLAYVLRSTDGGRTWGERASICGLPGKARLVRLKSGKLLACVYKLKPGEASRLFIAESEDAGLTWTNEREVAADLQPGGGSLTQLADGTVLLQFLYDAAPGVNPNTTWYNVEGLRAVVSHDEGRTWEKQVYVIGRQPPPGASPSGEGAYLGDSVELPGGRILTACVNHAGSGMRFQGIIWQPVREK